MLCKRTVKNQITLPKKIAERFRGIEYFDAEAANDKIILRPVEVSPARQSVLYEVRKKISNLGLSEKEIDQAISWARNK